MLSASDDSKSKTGLAQGWLERVDHGQVGALDGGRRGGRHGALDGVLVGRGLEQAAAGRLDVGHEAITVRISWRGTTTISIHGCSS